ncbi:hypothetical protein HDU97_008951 [Phlyctochytrium planicorne]|nr:hypothetical protein HDU97_008951 [Phlyctochytrium planicorne]
MSATNDTAIAVAAPVPNDSKPTSTTTTTAEDPTHAVTRIHAPRVFFYFSLFFLPMAFSLAFLSSPTVWHASIAPVSLVGPTALFYSESYIGVIRICTGDAVSNCRYIADVCKEMNGGSASDAATIDVKDALCGDERKSAAAFAIIAVILGALVMIAYIDNILVWKGLSFWYHPKDHTTKQVRTIRDRFCTIILTLASLHAVALLIAVSLAVDLRSKIRLGLAEVAAINVDMYWGLYMGVAAIIVDVIFVIVFHVFDRFTFFAVPTGRKFDPLDA